MESRPQRGGLSVQDIGGCRLLVEHLCPRDRAAWRRIVGVAGNDVGVEVRNPVSEGEQVHLDGTELRLNCTGDSQHVSPVLAGGIGVKLGGLRYMTVPPDDDAVAREPTSPFQADLAGG